MLKRWNEGSFTEEFFGSKTALGKCYGWRLVSYEYVGAEQVLGVFNTYEKDLLREYHDSLLKRFESA